MSSNIIEGLNVLYVAPRYHTNQVPIMRGWYEHNCRVMFMAEAEGTEGISEVHDYVEFHKLKPSVVSKIYFGLIDRMYSPNQAEWKKVTCLIPAFFDTMKKIRSFQPDLVIVRERYIANAVIFLICKLLDIDTCVLYVQQPIYGMVASKNIVKKYLKRKIFPKAVFSPVYYHGLMRKKSGNSDVWFVPLVAGNNISEGPHDYFKGGRIRFLDVGKYREVKNHFFLIDVFDKLKEKIDREDVRLTIIGEVSNSDEENYYDKLNLYIKEKGLEDIIEMKRNIPFRKMENLYNEYDVLLLSSTNESAGMVILEAMEKGLCVAASIYCGLASYLDEYQCGYTFDINDTEELENLLFKLIKEKELICEMGNKGVGIIKSELNFEKYVEALNKLTEREFKFSIIKR